MSDAQEKLRSLRKRMASVCASVAADHEAVARAAIDHERSQSLLARIESISGDAVDPTLDEELWAIVETDIAQLEADVEQFVNDTPLARRFFKAKPPPNERAPVTGIDPDAYRKQRVVWRVGSLDLGHPQDWLAVEDAVVLLDVLTRLKEYERLTWTEVDVASRHNHPWDDWSDWEPASQERLRQLELDDQSGWYQLHLDKRGRLYGFRDGPVFNVLWWDREHEVYVTKQK